MNSETTKARRPQCHLDVECKHLVCSDITGEPEVPLCDHSSCLCYRRSKLDKGKLECSKERINIL